MVGVVLVVAVLVIALLLVFRSGSSKPPTTPMASYANNPTAQVSMLIDGPVNAPSLHNQVQVVINNTSTTFNVFQGYDSELKANRTFPMSEAAFHVFLRSLEYANYNSGSNNPALSQASGYCPTGDRYIFSFSVNGVQKQRYWATSCGGTQTYGGNLNLTIQLFQAQVPNYGSLIGGLNI